MNELEDDELSVDLTPLIDVTFMLVIFFIMTMSFTLPVIDFTLPQSATAQVENQGHNLRIGVNSAGVFSVNNVVYPESELGRIVEEHVIAAQAQQQELTLELVIDADAPTQYLITVADLARTYTQGRLMVVSEKTDNSTAPAPLTPMPLLRQQRQMLMKQHQRPRERGVRCTQTSLRAPVAILGCSLR